MPADPATRRRPTALALAVVLVAGAAGCADEPVAPLPVRPPVPTTAPPPVPTSPPSTRPSETPVVPPPAVVTVPSARPTPAPRAPTPQRSTRNPSPTATLSEACLGAVRYELPLSDPGPLPSSLCFATGGVLRLRGIGPGEVTVDREDLVDSQYEAGVVDLRFVRSGTVDVFVPREAGTHVITVVVR
ncbi:hypothetical protein ACIBQ2_15680 [Micromonospora sediminimaris]|uniref:Uncharacterized protein n=1 Tax=Micromonospora sediminimaris TaxID=547162 RepID=A0A9W5USD9_9ACTN|nr:hypothetical protein [Micromonospora sediminimaris]GIJ33611.1 hypothetical protein Vse01_27590 [Micromonospora sediminimaris]SFC89638.1 hypothetical protein SAMN05216284_108137 [Micromonospora sediminimaris]